MNACVATPFSSAREGHLLKTEFDSRHVGEVEEWIDSYTAHLPPLENFILPVLIIPLKHLKSWNILLQLLGRGKSQFNTSCCTDCLSKSRKSFSTSNPRPADKSRNIKICESVKYASKLPCFFLKNLFNMLSLSDLLFTLARYAAKLDGKQETVYLRPGKN